jgi:hypothetical protein
VSYRNRVVAVFGRKGSGKSQYLWDTFTAHAAHKISLFSQPEDQARFTSAIRAVGWAAFSKALLVAARFDRWHIDAVLEPSDVAQLFALLCPPFGGDRSLAVALKGVTIDCGEVHQLMPNGRTPPEISGALFKSRHYQLDMNLATQRPASVSIDLRSQADEVTCFALESKRDMLAAAEELRLDSIAPIIALRQYECLHRSRDEGRTVKLSPDRQVIEVLTAPLA